jgi:leucyl/phenylalanyl-tRNA--protein transferase
VEPQVGLTVWPTTTMPPAGGVPVAIGGALSPELLLAAYRGGCFCQPTDDPDEAEANRAIYQFDVRDGAIPVLPGRPDPYAVLWWDPDTRFVIPVDEIRLGRSLRHSIRANDWTTTLDGDFDAVVAGCRAGRDPTWLTDELVAALRALHEAGWLHSVEVWQASALVGGLFGCALGKVFVMDSTFHRRPDAGKVAIADLARRVRHGGIRLLDGQVRAGYTLRLGAVPMSRQVYRAALGTAGGPGRVQAGPAPANRLLDG